MNMSLISPFQKKEYRVLLVDDRLGYHTSAGFLQFKLNNCFEINLRAFLKIGTVYEFVMVSVMNILYFEETLQYLTLISNMFSWYSHTVLYENH